MYRENYHVHYLLFIPSFLFEMYETPRCVKIEQEKRRSVHQNREKSRGKTENFLQWIAYKRAYINSAKHFKSSIKSNHKLHLK